VRIKFPRLTFWNDDYLKYILISIRIDGAWYVCMDEGVKPIKNKCVVLSFGILNDASFDAEMSSNYKCQVESFDPYYVNEWFRKKEYENVLTMNVNASWRYHKMGITGDSAKVTKNNSVGWIAKIEDILEYTQLTNKVIDVFKMDIENNEWSVLMNLDLDYACKYIKQFVLETHTELGQSGQFDPLKVLRKLEKCFLLFHRDTRFFYLLKRDKYGFYVTEFQDHKDYKLNLTEFDNEIKLINFMFTYGELYFVNKNFLD
jgi:hypothetical protein